MSGAHRDRAVPLWLAVGTVGYCLLPWYLTYDGFASFGWLFDGWPGRGESATALALVLQGEKLWLAPLLPALLIAGLALRPGAKGGGGANDRARGQVLILAGALGLAWLCLQGFAIGLRGWDVPVLEALFGPLEQRQFGIGAGALLYAMACLFLLTTGLAARGAVNGDRFVVGSIGLIVAIVLAFIFFPISRMLAAALQDRDGRWSSNAFVDALLDDRIWGLACTVGQRSCGAAWNSLFLATVVGVLSTALGLAFALVATRSRLRDSRALRALTILPIITPPFVIGLAIILLFGLSGTVTQLVADALGLQPTRWVYGLPGILIAQLLSFTPIAFLVMIGVVEGVSASMEEASQTLRASRWYTFRTVTLPLMRPGLANAFLLGFIESMADFGNPLVLGGNYDVLSTEIFFAVVGAQYDQGRAAVLAIVLLVFTLGAFQAQRYWLGNRLYVTRTGKGDGGAHAALPRRVLLPCLAVAGVWGLFTLTVYAMIVYGSFVELWGLDHTLTFKHYLTTFAIEWGDAGLRLRGVAWDSFLTTLQISALAAPFTAMLGLVTAWLLVRQRFAGKGAFEFATMLSFAVPGTVIGVSYILAFNVPPIELTGTAAILVISFIFRNMPVGVRAGIASMSQLDKSLDEASLTLGASSFHTFRRVILPLMKPAILAALVYSFVQAMTAISAVIFLVSAEHDMATSYIIGRVENNDYGIAIAYSTVLIVVMLAAIGLLQLLVGRTDLTRSGKRGQPR